MKTVVTRGTTPTSSHLAKMIVEDGRNVVVARTFSYPDDCL